ncbi:MoaD/ThiS family protein [Rhizobiaceae bacterium n13]|uniref:MoaD/ThiS family protein n=1 Tax=Ferirhizobium litorale TaxID=2927786 RepID=A0AAE3QDN4_9HYPH|nr:MoaD/ThiS family protein [Fererhizobium litorale]MDI7861201.1 MoaD/ThiS family protein [Fererhizobium litorale]MDI7921348.1 MoaD/ThiS family protein [Fererhizobium litorale]
MGNSASLKSKPDVHVRLPGVLVDLFPEATRDVAVRASNVRELIEALDALWPGMADRLRDSRPAIRKHINIFIDGERAKLSTPLAPGSQIYILTAISGG